MPAPRSRVAGSCRRPGRPEGLCWSYSLETIPDLVLLYLVLVDADRDSGTDAEELVVPAFVDVGFGQGSLCVSLSEALYTLVPVVLVLPRTVLRVTYDEAVAVAIRDIVEDARLVRRG